MGALALCFTILFSSIFMPTQTTYAAGIVVGGKARVTNTDGDTIRVRAGAGTEHRQISEAYEGQVVIVLAGPVKDSKGIVWYKVQAPRGTGWMMGQFLSGIGSSSDQSRQETAGEPNKQAAMTPIAGYAKVSNTDGDRLRVRSAASRGGTVLTTLAPDSVVLVKQGPVTDREGIVWYQVSANGITGWVMGQYLAQSQAPQPEQEAQSNKPAARETQPQTQTQTQAQAQPQPAPQAQQAAELRSGTPRGAEQPAPSNRGAIIVSNALKFVGYRYRFGGTSPAGFDCSGFVYYVMKISGLNVGRSMYAQLNSGQRISTKDLQPGDLLFWSNTYKRGLSHAGIYIGNGKFIHAENERTGVRISSMYTAYWASRFTAAVRPR
jgi:cell wall-associated NlpC family hydrolase